MDPTYSDISLKAFCGQSKKVLLFIQDLSPEPMAVSPGFAKGLIFLAFYKVVRGDRAISADTAIRFGNYFGLPAQFWLNLQNDYDLRIAKGSGVGKKIKPRTVAHDVELATAR